jgi:hypothetical protein
MRTTDGRTTTPTAHPPSIVQQRRVTRRLTGPRAPAQNVELVAIITGELDLPSLRDAVAALVARHESLRTRFVLRDGQPTAEVVDVADVTLGVVDAPGSDSEARLAQALAWARVLVGRPFDLGSPPLLHASVIGLEPERRLLVLVVDHLAADGWSVGLLASELSAGYAARRRGGGGSPSGDDGPPYSAWSAAQQEAFGERADELREFWAEHLTREVDDRRLAGYRAPAASHLEGLGCHARGRLAPAPTRALAARAASERVSIFVLLLHATVRIAAEQHGRPDVLLRTNWANRLLPDAERVVGWCAHAALLPLNAGAPLAATQASMLDALAHADVPASTLRELVGLPLVEDEPPLYVVLNPAWEEHLQLAGAEIEPVLLQDATVSEGVQIWAFERDGGMDVEVRHPVRTYRENYAAELRDRLLARLAALAEDGAA